MIKLSLLLLLVLLLLLLLLLLFANERRWNRKLSQINFIQPVNKRVGQVAPANAGCKMITYWLVRGSKWRGVGVHMSVVS